MSVDIHHIPACEHPSAKRTANLAITGNTSCACLSGYLVNYLCIFAGVCSGGAAIPWWC